MSYSMRADGSVTRADGSVVASSRLYQRYHEDPRMVRVPHVRELKMYDLLLCFQNGRMFRVMVTGINDMLSSIAYKDFDSGRRAKSATVRDFMTPEFYKPSPELWMEIGMAGWSPEEILERWTRQGR